MKTFEEIYNRVCINSKDRINELKRKITKFLLVILIIEISINIIAYFLLAHIYIRVTIILSVCLLLFLIVNARKIYSEQYRSCVINSLVREYDENLNFDCKLGVSKLDYLVSKFDKEFNEFYSEDKIYGKLKNNASIQLSEIATYNVYFEEEMYKVTSSSKVETFRGMYGFVKLEKSINGIINITRNNNNKKFDIDRIEIDSAEFEKYYDCFSDNKVMAMQIFTSDLIEKYIDIININDYSFEVKIVDNNIYFRYKCGSMFEPPNFGNGLNENTIRKYYKLVFYPLEVIKKTVENIYSILDIK